MKKSMRAILGGLGCAAMAVAMPLSAFALSDPIIESQTPAYIPPSPGQIVSLRLYGENIAPDNGNHPDYTQYWHIWIRSIAPNGAAGPWTLCIRSNGCIPAGFNSSVLDLQINGSMWAAIAGSQFQMHYYVGLDLSDASDPAQTKYGPVSGWSTLVTWKVQVAPPPAAPPPPPKVYILRAVNMRALAPALQLAPTTQKPLGRGLKPRPPN